MFSRTMVMSTTRGSCPSTLLTGRTLAYKSISFLSATIGLEYPATLCEGDETAPNMAAVHSDLRASTVSRGRAVPVFWKCSKPAWRGTNEGLGMPGTASRTRWAACATQPR